MAAKFGRATQFFLRARFDLADALARQAETVADLLQRVLLVVFETEAKPHHFALLAVEIAERARELFEVRLMDHFLVDRDLILREQVAALAGLPLVAAGTDWIVQ